MTTLRSLLVALGAALGLFAIALLGDAPGGPMFRAPAGVAIGIAVAAIMYGETAFPAIAVGAVSPLALVYLESTSLAAGAAAMCALWLAPRLVLAETQKKLVVLALVSLVAAIVAGSVFAAYVTAPLASHAASCLFAGSCLSLVGIVVPLPAPQTHALRTAAAVTSGATGEALVRAAEAFEGSRWQPRPAEERRQWRGLIRLSDRRAALERADGPRAAERRRDLDGQIETTSRELTSSSLNTKEAASASGSDATGRAPIAAATNAAATNAAATNEERIEAMPTLDDAPPAGGTLPTVVDAAIAQIERGDILGEAIRVSTGDEPPGEERQM